MTITIASTTPGLRKEGKGAENLSLSRHEEDHMTGNRCVKSAFIGHETSLSLSVPFPVFLTGIYLSNLSFPIIYLTWKVVTRCHDILERNQKEPQRLREQAHRGNATT